jgi:NAD(P)-dependent dehydrogenase (short-subunit alcohol dehydrogenase family)
MRSGIEKVALVTGSSSGVGRACCERLAARGGWRVYGGSRTAVAGEGWSYLAMDVTDDASVARAVEELLGREGRIDALVHCAGVSLVGSIEDTTVEEARRHLDINYFGSVRVIRAVLPAMRQQAAGRIIVIGSIGGLIGLPYQGHYSAGKFALDGLVEALRTEIRPFGIEVCVLHPGDLNTAIGVHRVTSENANDSSVYDAAFRRAVAFYAASEKKGPAPDIVARTVERMLHRRRLPVRTVVGTALELMGVWGKTALPARTFEYLMRQAYGPEASRRRERSAGGKVSVRELVLRLARARRRSTLP